MVIGNPYPSARGPLLTGLVTLAGSPEYLSTIESQLTSVARLAVTRVAAAEFASITGSRGHAHVLVAVHDELVRSLDELPDPGFEPLQGGAPHRGRTIRWPRFHEDAARLGLHASVSVPLHTGRGHPVAVLNVYGRDPATMAPLLGSICAVRGIRYDHLPELTDEGGRELVAGYAAALGVRDRIRRALATIMRANACGPDDAYVTLCIRAAQNGTDLADAATAFLPSG